MGYEVSKGIFKLLKTTVLRTVFNTGIGFNISVNQNATNFLEIERNKMFTSYLIVQILCQVNCLADPLI